MPTPPLRSSCGPILIVGLAVAIGLAPASRGQENQLDVGVRASITDKAHFASKDKSPVEGGHGKVFGILTVNEVKSDRDLEKPVDETYLLGVFSHELEANGFRLHAKGERPDILLTLSYGRGELANPYLHNIGELGGLGSGPSGNSQLEAPGGHGGPIAAGGFESQTAPQQTIVGGIDQLMDEKKPGYEAKIQKASFEKLFIRVTAWAYPGKGAKVSKMLWKTIMVVDDPDNRDLNDVAAKMLESGAPYFDKQPQDKEVDVYKPLPSGKVNVGTPEVVESPEPKAK